MRILVITLLYAPDGGPSATLYQTLCEGLARRGHAVTMIAAVPHYPSGRVPPDFRGRWITRTVENSVTVIRVRLPSLNMARFSRRLIQFFVYQIGAAVAGWRGRYDAAILGNPALEIYLPALVHVGLRRIPALYSIHDVYPDVGVALGIFRNRLVRGMVGALEKHLYHLSKGIRLTSESFAPPLLRAGIPQVKMSLIYDWVDTEALQPRPRQNDFSAEHGLNDSFVALYAGNIGLSQRLETILAAAVLLPAVQFVFVGEGTGRDSLQRAAAGLPNVRILPFQPRERLPEVLATADVHLISLKAGLESGSLPSKTYSAFASGRPLLAIMAAGAAWGVIERAGAGVRCDPDDAPCLAAQLEALRADPLRRADMGRAGRAAAEKYHSAAAAVVAFEAALQRIILSRLRRGEGDL